MTNTQESKLVIVVGGADAGKTTIYFNNFFFAEGREPPSGVVQAGDHQLLFGIGKKDDKFYENEKYVRRCSHVLFVVDVSSDFVAAIDLGSNSFHMIVARIVNGHVQVLDRAVAPERIQREHPAGGADQGDHAQQEQDHHRACRVVPQVTWLAPEDTQALARTLQAIAEDGKITKALALMMPNGDTIELETQTSGVQSLNARTVDEIVARNPVPT